MCYIKNSLTFTLSFRLFTGDVLNDLKLPPFEEIEKSLKMEQKNKISFFIKAVYEHLKLL
jgi:hypothetical protein